MKQNGSSVYLSGFGKELDVISWVWVSALGELLVKEKVKAQQWVSALHYVEEYYNLGSVTHTTVAKVWGDN